MLERFDQALPALMTNCYGPTMLGLGLTALTASLMSGLAANISAFAFRSGHRISIAVASVEMRLTVTISRVGRIAAIRRHHDQVGGGLATPIFSLAI